MARKVFFSFHYQLDNWRVQQIRNIGAVAGQPLLGSNDWEDVAKGGDAAIQKWIDTEMVGKSCNVVLIGAETQGRRWVEYEFKKAWVEKKGLLGINIHNLQDQNRQVSQQGANPFSKFTLKNGTVQFDSIVPVHDPMGRTSSDVYSNIAANLEAWVEDAIAIRQKW